MKKLSLIILISVAVNSATLAQDSFLTKTGYVQFFSTTPVEDIKSENYKVVSRLNTKTGEIVFSIPIQSFEFEKALMQKHFNSKNFMDSKKYPKAKFKGNITNISQIDLSKNGTYIVDLKGNLFIHGVEREIKAKATLEVKDGAIFAEAKFFVRPNDFDIIMLANKKDNLAEIVEVTLKLSYKSFNAES